MANFGLVVIEQNGSYVRLKSDDKSIRCYLTAPTVKRLMAVPNYHTYFHGDRYHVKGETIKLARQQVMRKYGNVEKVVSDRDNIVLVYCSDIQKGRKLSVSYNISYDHHNPIYGSTFRVSSLERLELEDLCTIL